MQNNPTIDIETPGSDFAFDAARTFVGPSASYYDEAWRQMAWRGRHTSWNSMAAAFGPFWFAYRRMRLMAVASTLWLILWLELWRRGWPPGLLLGCQLAVMAGLGCFANRLYLARFVQLSRHLEQKTTDVKEREFRMADAGGVSHPAVLATASAVTAAILLLELFR